MYWCGRGRGCGFCFFLTVVSILFAFVFGVFIFGCGSVRGDCVRVVWWVAKEDVQRIGEGDSEHLFFLTVRVGTMTWITDDLIVFATSRLVRGPVFSDIVAFQLPSSAAALSQVGHGFDGVARHRIPTRARRR